MICALDKLEKYRYDLYNGHCEEVFFVREEKHGVDDNKTTEGVKQNRECIEVKDVVNVLDDILGEVKHLVSL